MLCDIISHLIHGALELPLWDSETVSLTVMTFLCRMWTEVKQTLYEGLHRNKCVMCVCLLLL